MKRPAIFFDRDNTLIVNDGYLGDPAGVTLVPGAADAIARARSMGYLVVTVSNQSGVARGLFTEDDVRRVNERMDALLLSANRAAVIDRHEFCPYHPDATVDAYRQDSDLRKPKPGMIHRAAEKLAIDLDRSWLIGDAPRDIEAGHAAGLRTILFADPALPASPAIESESQFRPDITVSTMKQAIDYVESHRHQHAPDLDDDGSQSLAIASTPSPDAPGSSDIAAAVKNIEQRLTQIAQELKRTHDRRPADASVTQLFAGIAQILVLAALFFAYLYRADLATAATILLLALVFQTMTVALLLMGQHR